jgi:hypothetical protein
MGCFVGTPPDFADAHKICGANKGCGQNAAACSRGEVTPLLPCSGNGIVQKREYRDEYFCECGLPVVELNATTDVSLLLKNGFGGEKCNQYTCNEGLGEFSLYDKKTKVCLVLSVVLIALPPPARWPKQKINEKNIGSIP